jgi:hypothetical protein
VVGVEAADARRVGERDRQVPVREPRGAQRGAGRSDAFALGQRRLGAPGLDLDLDLLGDRGGPAAYAPRRAERMSGA